MDKELTHLDERGQPGMVDVTDKKVTARTATASGRILISDEAMSTLRASGFHNKKGSIIHTAIIAATMAVKNTHNTIPLCHQLPIGACTIDVTPGDLGFYIECTVKTNSQTGVEMEALHGVAVAALTIYDMCKAISHDMTISDIQLMKKTGGKSDYHGPA